MLQDFLLYFTDPGLRQTAEIRLPQDQLTAVTFGGLRRAALL